jgi:DNA invertase Pin-like site-specific DNA recombinase
MDKVGPGRAGPAQPAAGRSGVAIPFLERTLPKRSPFFLGPGMRIGYARLSEEDQTLPLQRQALQKAGCGQVYEERARGKTTRRPRKLPREAFQAARALRGAGQVPVKAIAARFGVAPSTVYRNLTEPTAPDACLKTPAAYA